MQTWAKRGVQAALFTGGMIAVGSGVASASDTCPDHAQQPLGELADHGSGWGFRCISGELFPENNPAPPQSLGDMTANRPGVTYNRPLVDTGAPHHRSRHSLSDAVTQELPVIRDQHWLPQNPVGRATTTPLQLAGWVADPALPGDSRTPPGLPVPHPSSIGTPAQGFHRSLTWAGPIGHVIEGARSAPDSAFRAAGAPLPAPVVNPSTDPAVVEGFAAERSDSIVALWRQALDQAAHPGGLVSPRDLDLTSAGHLAPTIHTVPNDLLRSTLTRAAPNLRHAVRDTVPLAVPGEFQDKANEVPNLRDLPLVDTLTSPARTTRPVARDNDGQPGVQTPLPPFGKLNAGGGGNTSVPVVDRVGDYASELPAPTGRSAPAAPQLPAFSDKPAFSDVAVYVVDELMTAVPERDVVAQMPAAPIPSQRSAEPRKGTLPGLGKLPHISALRGQTLPTPGLDDTAPLFQALNVTSMPPLDRLPARI